MEKKNFQQRNKRERKTKCNLRTDTEIKVRPKGSRAARRGPRACELEDRQRNHPSETQRKQSHRDDKLALPSSDPRGKKSRE